MGKGFRWGALGRLVTPLLDDPNQGLVYTCALSSWNAWARWGTQVSEVIESAYFPCEVVEGQLKGATFELTT